MTPDPMASSELPSIANPATPRRWSACQIVLLILATLSTACCLGVSAIVGFVWFEYHRYHQRQIDRVTNEKPLDARIHAMHKAYVNQRVDFEATHNSKVIQFDGKVIETSEKYVKIRDHADNASHVAYCYFDDPAVLLGLQRDDRVKVKGYFGSMGRTPLGLSLKLELTHCQLVAEK